MILSSSFPSSPDDETCGYVREFARQMTPEFDVQVLTHTDARASHKGAEYDDFHLRRAESILPQRLDPLQAGSDFNSLLSGNLLQKLLALISLAGFFIQAFKLARHADVICSHWLLPCGLMGAVLGVLLHKPHIAIEHSGALHLLLRIRGGRALAKFIVRRSRRIVTVSSDLKHKLITLCPEAKEKTEVFPMGVRIAAVTRPPDDGSPKIERQTVGERDGRIVSANRILYLGRLVEIKGVEVLLKAVATLRGVQLLVAGDGEEREALARVAEKLNVDAVFFGQVGKAEKAELFAASAILVIPSLRLPDGRTEGLPVVALEAFAAGLPVIAARVGGLSEIIIDGQNGLLFEAGNHLLLADRIGTLLGDHQLRGRLVDKARQTAEAFDWQIIGAKFSKIMKDCVGTNGSVERYQTASDLKL